MTDNSSQDLQARRREQIRLAQRRRRERLAQGSRKQVNIYLNAQAIARLDALALLWGVERQEVIERLLAGVHVDASVPESALPKSGQVSDSSR